MSLQKQRRPWQSRGPASTISSKDEAILRKRLREKPLASLYELKKALGDSVSHQTIKTWCDHLGLKRCRRQGRRTKLSAAIEKRLRHAVARMPASGYKGIATALGVPAQTVRDWIKRLGLTVIPARIRR